MAINIKNIKTINLILPPVAFIVSFALLFIIMNEAAGDLVTLMYGGVSHPDDYQPGVMTIAEYNQALADYEQTKDELGIYDFPFSIVNLILNLLRLDFGINYETLGSIFEELLERFPPTFMLSDVGVLFSLALLVPLCILRYNKEITEEKTHFKTIIKLISISGPILFLFWFILLFTTDLWDIFPRFWRDDAFPFTFFYPGLFLILAGVVSGSIVLSLGYSNRTVLKISTITTISVEFIIEPFFGWPGLGNYFYRGLMIRNYPILFIISIIFALAVTIMLIAIELVPSNFFPFSSKNQLPLRILKVQDNKKLLFEVIIVACTIMILGSMFIAPNFAPYDPITDDYTKGYPSYAPPGGEHLLGTDWGGHDIFSRVLYSVSYIVQLGVPIGILSLLGYVCFFLLKDQLMDIHSLFISLIVIIFFISYFGLAAGFSAIFGYPEFIDVMTILVLIIFGFPIGFLYGKYCEQHSLEDLIQNSRRIFCFSFLFQFIFLEMMKFMGLYYYLFEPSFGGDLASVIGAFEKYLFATVNVLVPLIAIMLIFTILSVITYRSKLQHAQIVPVTKEDNTEDLS